MGIRPALGVHLARTTNFQTNAAAGGVPFLVVGIGRVYLRRERSRIGGRGIGQPRSGMGASALGAGSTGLGVGRGNLKIPI